MMLDEEQVTFSNILSDSRTWDGLLND